MTGGRLQGLERPALKAESAEDLRALISEAELIVGNLRGAGCRAATLLFLLDSIQDLMARLSGSGIDLRPEATRIETVSGLLQSKDVTLVREMRSCGGLAAAREAVKPAPSQWWWYLDRRVSKRRQSQFRRILMFAGTLTALLLVLSLLYRYVFPPDPMRVAAMERASRAEQLLLKGDLVGAAEMYREAVEILPGDPEMHTWVGVLEELQGNSHLAADAFGRAEGLSPDRARYLVGRGMAWLWVGALERAQADGEAAQELRPDMPEVYFVLGGVYEAGGDIVRAIAAFEKASDLAEKADNPVMVVMARTRMGMLMQSGPALFPTPSPTPEN